MSRAYEVGNRALANRALSEARTMVGRDAAPGETYGGEIMAIQGDGQYRVGEYDENGVITRIHNLVGSNSEYQVGDVVTVRVDMNDSVTILTGGGGGGCQAALTNLGGVLFG